MPLLFVGGNITKTCLAAVRMATTPIKKSRGCSLDHLQQIIKAYGSAKTWFHNQLATMCATGFTCVLRLGEVRMLTCRGVRFVLYNRVEWSPSFRTGKLNVDNMAFCLASEQRSFIYLGARHTGNMGYG